MSRPGEGEERRVESTQAGGGAGEKLEWRWAALSAGGRGGSRAEQRHQRKKKRGGGSEGSF
jgi:hypothetical protein